MTVLIPYQNALRTALQADSTLMSMISGIFDYFPTGATLPYIAFGEATETPNDPIGTVTGNRMSDVTMTIYVVNDAPGRQTSLAILDEIEIALDMDLTLSRGTVVERPEMKITKATEDVVTGVWKIPLEVHQLITNV